MSACGSVGTFAAQVRSLAAVIAEFLTAKDTDTNMIAPGTEVQYVVRLGCFAFGMNVQQEGGDARWHSIRTGESLKVEGNESAESCQLVLHKLLTILASIQAFYPAFNNVFTVCGVHEWAAFGLDRLNLETFGEKSGFLGFNTSTRGESLQHDMTIVHERLPLCFISS